MSLTTKLVTTYSKSLFQSLNYLDYSKEKENLFQISKITSSDQNKFLPDVFDVGEELLLIRSIFICSKKVKDFVKNPTYSEKLKLEIILNLFPGLTLIMKSFLRVLAEKSHLYLIPEISEEYHLLLLKFKKATKIKLIIATPLEDNFGTSLLKFLKQLTHSNEIILSVAYNPKLVGGFILEYNSRAIDASVLKAFNLLFTNL